MALLIGLDVGTSNIKAAAYRSDGGCVARASTPTPTTPAGLRQAEQHPGALWEAVAETLATTLAACGDAPDVAGLCVASVGEAGVPLDAHGEPTYPIIAWYDQRTASLPRWWDEAMGAQPLFALTGLPLGHTFSLLKMQWLRQMAPEAWAATQRWLAVGDYVGFRLTGQQATGYSQASRTMALDLTTRAWSDTLLSIAELPPSLLPTLVPEGTLLGHALPEAAAACRLPEGTPVFVGGHDHPVAAIAMGATEPGVVLDSTGTTETELMTIPSVRDILARGDGRFSVGCHAAPGSYYVKGGILGAGSLLRWVADLCFADTPPPDRLDALYTAAEASPPGARGLYLLPHLAGAGSPDRDSMARGVMAGLTLDHSRNDLARAAFEGLVYELKTLLNALAESAGHGIDRVIAAGGGSQSPFWTQLKADVTGRPILVSPHTEAVTLGAAMLAGVGAGIYRSLQDAQATHAQSSEAYTPDPARARDYQRLYQKRIAQIRALCLPVGALSGQLWERDLSSNPDSNVT